LGWPLNSCTWDKTTMRTKDLEAMAKAFAEVQEKARQEAAQRQAEYLDKGAKATIVMDPNKKKKEEKNTETEISTQEAVKFMIPEEIPTDERTAFHGAAAAAAKSGKSHFSFNGKKYPATMQKDTARSILDTYHKGKMKKEAKEDEVVEPVNELKKSTLTSYIKKASNDAAVRAYDAADSNDSKTAGKQVVKSIKRLKGVARATDKLAKEEVEVDEATNHGNMDNGSPRGEGLSPSAKKELARTTPAPAAVDVNKVLDLDFKTFKAMGKKAKSRPGDNAKGDNSVIPSATPVKD